MKVMSRQLDAKLEEQQRRRNDNLLLALNGGLEEAVSRAGGTLTGINVKMGEGDVLLILKAVFPAGAQVGFVGGETLPDVILKAVREAGRDQVKWRTDRWAGGG
jgi:hypothetical protein